jgi:uncharacterized protein YndB with AHSA1/START domain
VLAPVARPPVIEYRRAFTFATTPEMLWDYMTRVDQFERWWPWLQEFHMDGESLVTGAILRGVVVPPLPYRIRVRVEVERYEPPVALDATIDGDLVGRAQLRVRPDGGAGAVVEVAWTVEMMQRPMRLASRFGRPLLQWGHDRVVESTVDGFRRRLKAADV